MCISFISLLALTNYDCNTLVGVAFSGSHHAFTMATQDAITPLKRDYNSYSTDEELGDLEKPFTADSQFVRDFNSQEDSPPKEEHGNSIPSPPVSIGTEQQEGEVNPTLSRRSSSASLSDAKSRTPSLCGTTSPMPGVSALSRPTALQKSAFAAMNGAAPPQPKKRKLTFKEKEEELIMKQIKDAERAEKEAAREAERKRKEADKATKESERRKREVERAIKEAERKKREVEREAEKLAKDAERKKKEAEKEEKRLAHEAERAAKAELKRKKDEEKQLVEEKKKKELQKQKPINSFFGKPAASPAGKSEIKARSMSPAPSNPSNPTLAAHPTLNPALDTPTKSETSPYYTMFPAFFLKEDVSLAPINRFERDEEASAAVQALVDSYINGDKSPGYQLSFNAVSLFHLAKQHSATRGLQCAPVREIMAEFAGNPSRPIDLTTDSQNSQIKRTSDLLRKVPMKFLKFQEDVRPPYRGTYTNRPVNGIAKLARNPMRRDLPNTNYDYDSEAEWVEEEGDEDLDSDGEDEEIDDDVDDMEGFLDDEGDVVVNSKRLVVQGDLEPISTGLCWEDQHKKNTHVKLVAYRMEVILSESFAFVCLSSVLTISDPKLKSIDPFSTEYWASSSKTTKMEPPRVPLDTLKPSASAMNAPNANKTVKPFFTAASEHAKTSSLPAKAASQTPQSMFLPASMQDMSKADKPKKLLPSEDMELFRNEVRGSDLSKVGMIEVLKKKFPQRTAAQVKGTLETFGSRVGKKEVDKRWVLVDETTT